MFQIFALDVVLATNENCQNQPIFSKKAKLVHISLIFWRKLRIFKISLIPRNGKPLRTCKSNVSKVFQNSLIKCTTVENAQFMMFSKTAVRAGAQMGGCGGRCDTPNNFTIRSQSLFCGVKVGPDPALNLNCLMFVNGSEQSCTTKLCYSRSWSRFCC